MTKRSYISNITNRLYYFKLFLIIISDNYVNVFFSFLIMVSLFLFRFYFLTNTDFYFVSDIQLGTGMAGLESRSRMLIPNHDPLIVLHKIYKSHPQ